MEQRDLLKAEIERMGQAIGKVVARFLGTAGNNLPPAQWESAIQKGLKDGPDLPLKSLMDLDETELLALAQAKSLTETHLEQLADLFTVWAETEELRETRLLLANRALVFLQLSDRISANYSFSRAGKSTKLSAFIQNLQK